MNYYSGKDLARNHRVVRKNTLQLAEEIPEAQYGFRPAPDSRSVAETLAHIAAATRWPNQMHGVEKKTLFAMEDFGRHMQATAAYETSLKTKAEIVAALEQNGREFADWLETLSDADLGTAIEFPPPVEPSRKTRFEMLLGSKEHEMHHRAQLMVVQRMLGMVPHLTRARQARQAQPAAAAR
jgi:uncharacterized damage-inducible protein DinB